MIGEAAKRICRGLYFRVLSKTQCPGFVFFSKIANKVFIEKSKFFSKKPPFVTKTFCCQENLNFDYLKRVFPAFCMICLTNRRPKAWKCAQF